MVDEARENELITEDDLAILDNFIARQKARWWKRGTAESNHEQE